MSGPGVDEATLERLRTALHYGLNRAKPDSAAHILAVEVERLQSEPYRKAVIDRLREQAEEIERLRAVTHAQHAELLQLRAAVHGDPARERS